MFRKTKLPLIVIFLLLLSLPLLTLLNKSSDRAKPNFSQEISKCNSAKSELRFSCYRSALETAYGSRKFTGPEEFNREIEGNTALNFHSDDNSYAVFGTNCHTFYHAVGDFIATKVAPNTDPKESVK